MPYIEETCVAGNTIEKCRYYTSRVHTEGIKREKKEKPTGEAQKKVNQRKAVKNLRRLMNCNFKDGDYLVRLDFHNMPEIDAETMQGMITKALRNIRGKKKEVRYIYVKEMGKRGSRHIHLMISKIDADLLRKYWPHGGIHIDPLISHGQYSKIAEYFVKYANRTEESQGELIGKRWYGSRNLVKPKITKKVILAHRFRDDIRVKKGFYLDKESVRQGICELTGYEYMAYTMIKTDKVGAG